MKKLSLLLSFILLFIFLISSCSNDTQNVSSSIDITSEPAETNESSEHSDEPKPNSVLTEISVSETPNRAVISTNAPYTKSAEADPSKYPDTYGTELTDGVTGTAQNNFSNETLSGYQSDNLEVTVDLGSDFDSIYSFEVGYYSTNGGGIGAPERIFVAASLDGKEWINIGELARMEFVEGSVLYATLVLDKYINARYIRFTLENVYPWMFLDEVIVVADIDNSMNDTDIEFKNAVDNAYQELGTSFFSNDGKEIDRTLDKVLISKDKKYATNGKIDSRFPDNGGKMLTDGKFSNYYEGGTWVGYTDNDLVTIRVDLGKIVDDIAEIEASFFVNTSIRLFMPAAVEVVAIDNKNNKTVLGIMYGNTVLKNGDYSFVLPLRETVSARYIEFRMYAVEASTFLIEELAVYSYRETSEKTLYPALSFDKNNTEWGSDESNEYENLISGRTQQIYASADPNAEHYGSYYNSSVTSKLLTDGNFATENSIHNNEFFKFYMGASRKVIYDLEHLSSVDKFTASFTHFTDWAVYAPSYVSVLVSENGTNWYKVGEVKLSGNGENDIYKGELLLDENVIARYVAFDFVVKTWTACDELEVFGTKSTDNAVSAASYPSVELITDSRKAPSDNLLGGSKDLCLLYYSTEEPGYTVNDLLPYLAYVDSDGVPKDLMFDSFLFLQSGNFPKGNPQTGSYRSDWEWSNEHLFAEGINIMALEEAAGTVKSALNLSDDYKFKVTMSLYYPAPSITDFGDVDGDGISEDLSIEENRLKVLKWYIDEVEKLFENADFKNIELVGYYWWHEDVLADDTGIRQLLNSVSEYLHSIERDFFWIPWFSAPGFQMWEELGFDIACMQPNYVFDAATSIDNIKNCALITESFGMGIEMEIFEESLRDELFFEKYMQYLAGGVEYGYMTDAVNMYYQSLYVYRDAAYSDELMARTVYDATYHYIKGDLQYKPDLLTELVYSSDKDKVYVGTIEFGTEKLRKLQLSLVPDHGSVTLNDDGTFIYYPEEGYSGEVTFSFVYSEYLGWSDPCEVVINVK